MHVHLPSGRLGVRLRRALLGFDRALLRQRPEPGSIEDLLELYERLDLVGVLLGLDARRQGARDRQCRTGRDGGRPVAQMGGSWASGSVDPNRDDALERLARFPELGLRGLKLHPTMQVFDPGEDRFLPFFDAAAELGLDPCSRTPGRADSVLASPAGKACGSTSRARSCSTGSPRGTLGMSIVLAHVGWPWHLEAVAMALHKSNVYLDISRLEVPLPARRGQARDPAPAARPVLLRHRLPDVRPGGLPDRARPARAAAGRRPRGPAR